jgi:hypothetical protein
MESTMLFTLMMATSAGIILALGTIHLYMTFGGHNLHPRDPRLILRMDSTHVSLTRETTVWRAWIGFNGSHSIGAILFGLVYGYLATQHRDMLSHSTFLLSVGGAVLIAYTVLAWCYWFTVPLYGCALAAVLFIASLWAW